MHAFAVRSNKNDQIFGNFIYLQPLNSAEEVKELREQLIEGDKKIERHFYFSHVQQAMKVETVFLKAVALVKGFFLDLITLPYRMYTYVEYKNELKTKLPIYQYLQNQKVPQKYLDRDRFEVVFFSGETPYEFEDRNYQQYEDYTIDVYNSVSGSSTSTGWALLTDEWIAGLSQRFVAP